MEAKFDENTHLQLVEILKEKGITHPLVLKAFERVSRADYLQQIDEITRSDVYNDRIIPLKQAPDGRWISSMSQPTLVARMLELALEGLVLKENEPPFRNVLEIGTASGFNAALLSTMSENVITMEIDPDLAVLARNNINRAGVQNVNVIIANGLDGYSDGAPYDLIIVTAGLQSRNFPIAWKKQMQVGGRAIVPMSSRAEWQILQRFTKLQGGMRREYYNQVHFVPLVE